jgi:6-phosphogluconolactonase
MDRRTFNTAVMSAAATSVVGCATGGSGDGGSRTVFYQSVGDRLTHWDVDVDNATLTRRDTISLPSNVQYVWPHPSRKYLVASTSDAASGNAPNPGKVHRLCAVRVDAAGALALHGEPAALPQRPIHNSVDAGGAYALTCYNNLRGATRVRRVGRAFLAPCFYSSTREGACPVFHSNTLLAPSGCSDQGSVVAAFQP